MAQPYLCVRSFGFEPAIVKTKDAAAVKGDARDGKHGVHDALLDALPPLAENCDGGGDGDAEGDPGVGAPRNHAAQSKGIQQGNALAYGDDLECQDASKQHPAPRRLKPVALAKQQLKGAGQEVGARWQDKEPRLPGGQGLGQGLADDGGGVRSMPMQTQSHLGLLKRSPPGSRCGRYRCKQLRHRGQRSKSCGAPGGNCVLLVSNFIRSHFIEEVLILALVPLLMGFEQPKYFDVSSVEAL